MEGYTNTAAPDEALVGHALRVFGLKCHPEYEHLFVTGGWDNHLKVTGLVTNYCLMEECGVGVAGRDSNFGETDCRVLFRTVPHLWSPSGTQLSPVAPNSG